MDTPSIIVGIVTFLPMLLGLLMTPLSLLVPGIFLVILWRILRRSPTASLLRTSPIAPMVEGRANGCLMAIRVGILLAMLPISLFCGLMVASIGGVIYPPVVQVTTPWVCDGDSQLHTRDYSYKPGQHGTSMVFTCSEDGEDKDITMKVFGAATLLYSAISCALLLPLTLLLFWLLRRFSRSSVLPRSRAS